MPAGSEPAPGLPCTFRPFGVRIAVYAFGVLLYGTMLVIWLSFSAEVREQFTTFQRATIVFFGIVAGVSGLALARSRVEAREESVIVVNGYRSRRFAWNQVLAVNLSHGSPWATLDLSDGTSVPAMGIQGSDGRRAADAVRRIRGLLREQSRTERDD